MNEETNERTQDFRVRQNLGISQPIYRIKTLADLLAVPYDRRAVLCQALFAWLSDPNTRVPKPKWLSFHFWLGHDLPEFVWQDDGTQPTAKVIATLKIDAAEAIAVIRKAIVNTVEAGALPQSVLEAFDRAQQEADKPRLESEQEAKCQAAIEGLVIEYGLSFRNDGGTTIYTAPQREGRSAVLTTSIHHCKCSQHLEHLQAWLRHHANDLDTISTMRRRLRTYEAEVIRVPLKGNSVVCGERLSDYFLRWHGHELKMQPLVEFSAVAEALEWLRNPEMLRNAVNAQAIDASPVERAKARFGNFPPADVAFAGHPQYADLMKQATEALAMKHGALIAGFRHGVMSVPPTPEQMADPHFFLGVQKGRTSLAIVERLARGEDSTDAVLDVYAGVEEERASLLKATEETADLLERLTLPDITTVRTGLASRAYKLLKRAVDAEAALAMLGGTPARESMTRQVVCPVCHEPLYNYERGDEPTKGKLTCDKCDLHFTFHRGKNIEPDGHGSSAITVDWMDVEVGHWHICTKDWQVNPGMLFHADQVIELAGADFERGTAELVIRGIEVPLVDLDEYARPLTAEEVRERGLQPPLPERPLLDASAYIEDVPEEPTPAVEPPADTKGHEAQQALEKANPAAPGLIGKDAPRAWVFLSEVLGQFARYAVSQSPYLHPDGLLAVLDAIKGEIGDRFDPKLGWAQLNRRDIEDMLNESIMALPEVMAWNQRKNGNTSEFGFTSRYEGKRDPDDDFIDLQALITNVALACTREAHGGNSDLVSTRQTPQEPGGESGLWCYAEGIEGSKYLVLRRDGTVPEWPYFVLGARDLAAVHAMAGYAWYASLVGYPPQFVADCERFARAMAEYREKHGPGNPCALPSTDRKDHPSIIELMKAHERGESPRIVGIAIEGKP